MTTAAEGMVAEAQARRDRAGTAFDERFLLVRQRLVHLCTGLVGADEAEDVVQEVYLRTRSRTSQLRDPGSFDAWVARAAVNLCYNRHRARGRLVARLARLVRAGTTSDPDVGLRELVERLPTRERIVVVLHYGHGYRLDEIAELVGVTSGNARTILFRARRRLADQLVESDG
jgi:RNA polymerase sigma-70 factor, ECF subfamily